jgi:hypothetical protein
MRWLGARWLLVLLVVLAFSPVAASAAPPPHDPDGSSDAEDGPNVEPPVAVAGLELPALTITPDDIDEPGYGLSNGLTMSVADDSALLNTLMGGDEDEAADIQEQLEDAGWVQSYWVSFGIQSGDDPSLFATVIYNALTEYGDEDGAEVGYDLLREGNASSGFLPVRDADDVGDDSTVTRAATSSNGRPLNYLDIVFRVGPVVAEVYIAEYSDNNPDVETITALAESVAVRLEDAEPPANPGLSQRSLFMSGDGVRTTYNYYNRLADQQIPPFGTTAAQARSDDRFYRDAGVIDVYLVVQSMQMADADDGVLSYFLYLYRFDDEQNASAALEDWTQTWGDTPTSGYEDVDEVSGADTIGDESTVFSHTFVPADGDDFDGFRTYFQVGDTIVSLIMHAVPGVDEGAFVDVANAAADCIDADEPCAPLSVDEETLTGG